MMNLAAHHANLYTPTLGNARPFQGMTCRRRWSEIPQIRHPKFDRDSKGFVKDVKVSKWIAMS